ncbi:hypothetical protein CYLTODRAFT_440972 [Cylindrobasidium torrendii FP15055 ss-10]|uniref:Uncharacterized protein n=1 Tax=Cylindrobasidium torrendii FP15055 ss-10 TaxID=1314674 RepID=A0A0D7BNW9_9AGAR|nr:hypothetical protein CYLTODRAFT_440972 [Cylindrobasidium torrendii FP15055 ss-10]
MSVKSKAETIVSFELFSQLPVDLARYVVQLAIEIDPSCSKDLLEVSRAVRDWSERMIYRNVAVRCEGDAMRVLNIARSPTRAPHLLAQTVQILTVSHSVTWEQDDCDPESLLKACAGAFAVAFWSADKIHDSWGGMHNLTHMSITVGCLRNPLFPESLTHLALVEFSDPVSDVVAQCCSILKHIGPQCPRFVHFRLEASFRTTSASDFGKYTESILDVLPDTCCYCTVDISGLGDTDAEEDSEEEEETGGSDAACWRRAMRSTIEDINDARLLLMHSCMEDCNRSKILLGLEDIVHHVVSLLLLEEWGDNWHSRMNLWTQAEELVNARASSKDLDRT